MERSKMQENNKSPDPDHPPKPPSLEWLRLKSKKHAGRPYYINTRNGASVWNLADAVMPKSQKHDFNENREPKQAVAETAAPPEIKTTKENLLKRQISNDNVLKPMPQPSQMLPAADPNPNFTLSQQVVPYPPPNVLIHHPLVPPFPPSQITVPNYPPPPLPTQVFNYSHQMLPYYPQQQINMSNFTVPPQSNYCIPSGEIVNSNNLPYELKCPVQTTSVSMSSRFERRTDESEVTIKSIVKKDAQEIEKTKTYPVNNEYNHHQLNDRNPLRSPPRYLRNDGIKDLREIIDAKRAKTTKTVKFQIDDEKPHYHFTDNNERDIENQMAHLNVDDKVNNYRDEAEQSATVDNDMTRSNIGDNEWRRQNAIAGKIQSNAFLKRLKWLLPCSNEDIWYVVVDTNVFLSNCHFVKILLNYDDNCRILALSQVITELEGHMKQHESEARQNAAIAALQFIKSSPRVIKDTELIAKIKSNVRFATGDDQILDCIFRLSEHNFPLILLSNDKLLISKSKTSHVLSFTVPEIKKHLISFKVGEEDWDHLKPLTITFTNTPLSSSMTVATETVPKTANKYTEITTKSTEIQVSPLRHSSDSDAHTDFSLKHIQTETPNTKSLVDKDVQTTEDNFTDDYSNTEAQLKLTKKMKETTTDTERKNRKIKRSKWWSSRHKRVTALKEVSTSTDSVELTKSGEMQTKVQSLHNSPKNVSNLFNVVQEQSNDSDDSFSLSKRFSGNHLISDNSQLQPRTVDESPTNSSDVISNTRSSVTSVHNVIESYKNNLNGELDGDLFNVSDKAMEERLKTGSEEWISRFLQIMEEVLTQVLRQNPLKNNPYEPPWTIHEATVCLKEKFQNNTAIVDAATLLSFTIFSSSNKLGHVYRTLSPERFMKLFSHSWNLVIVLHEVLSGRPGSEDLEVAKDSLTKLLADIKGLSDTIDNFVDNSVANYHKNFNMDTHPAEHNMGSQGDRLQQCESPQNRSPILQNPKKDPVLTQASSEYAKVKRSFDNAGLIKSINNYNATNQFDQDEFTKNIHTIKTPDYAPPEETSKEIEDTTFSPKTPDTTSSPNQSQMIVRKFARDAEFEKNMKRKITSDNYNYDIKSLTRNNNPKVAKTKKFVINKHSSTSTATTKDNPVTKKSLKQIPELKKVIIRKDNDELDRNMLSSKTNSKPVVKRNLKEMKEKLDKTKHSLRTTSTTNENQVINRNLKFAELDKRVIRKESDKLEINKHSSTLTATTNANLLIKPNVKKSAEFKKSLINKDIKNIEKNKKTSTISGNPAEIKKRIIWKDNDKLDRAIPTKAPISQSPRAAFLKPARSNIDMDMLSYSDDECDGRDDLEDDKHKQYKTLYDDDDNLLESCGEYMEKEHPKVTIKAFLAEIKDTFLHVRSHCEQTYSELTNDKIINSERKVELKEQTEDMHAFLNSLLSTLNSILLRENNSESFKIGDSQCPTYSVIIEKCYSELNILLDVLSKIIHDILV